MAPPHKAVGSKSEKMWRDALMRAVKRREQGKGKPHQLELIADACVKEALKGEMAAIREIGDRLDGKSAQTIAMGGDPDGEPLTVEVVQFSGKVAPDDPPVVK